MKEITVALAGNPNVGKSTLFNRLTGLRQHTGNWPGKTVALAEGWCARPEGRLHLVDLPGAYSLSADSPEEELAGEFILSGRAQVTVVVADATNLARSLNLALQIRQLTEHMVLCVNLLDEARRKGIRVNLAALAQQLSCPVAGISARSGRGVEHLLALVEGAAAVQTPPFFLPCAPAVESALQQLGLPRQRGLSLLLGREQPGPQEQAALRRGLNQLEKAGFTPRTLSDSITAARVRKAESIAAACVTCQRDPNCRDRRLDALLTGRLTGLPAMLLLLGLVFYLTVWGASAPSAWLERVLFSFLEPLRRGLAALGLPLWLRGLLADGVYQTVAWVVAVMLPPMAIFFPLFTLLEDMGYLPRVAFNLDGLMARCGAHGRQSLTMCMSLGCNACGVTGCRIIDSPRERLTAQLTASLVPCNGRLPTLLVLLSLFFLGNSSGPGRSLLEAALFLLAVLFSVVMSMAASGLLSHTLLRGTPSSFSLELPPYRLPRVGQVLVRSLLDRTVFVLGRAVLVAAPAGAILWLCSHIRVGTVPGLSLLSSILEPIGQLMGLDGMILLAFLLAFPANELLLPILAMGYQAAETMTAVETPQLGLLLVSHGWTWRTALCAMVLCLFHLPCGTTCLTLLRETGSRRWTAAGMLLPLAMGAALCLLLNLLLPA